MEEDYHKRMTAMKADEAFMKWIAEYLPDWEQEYSGDIFAMHDAFNAGRDAQRDDDHVNSDHE